MSKAHPPELKKYMDKKLALKLNGGRLVSGILRGYDPFMNLVVDEAVEEVKGGEKHNIGMVPPEPPWKITYPARICAASKRSVGDKVIRGNSIVLLEALDRI